MAAVPTTERMSDAAVQAKTGKTWDEWFSILDAAGAARMSHKEIVACLATYDVGPWWQQMVTVTYEKGRGLREKHQMSGGYEIGSNKTIAVPLETLYNAWEDAKLRRKWLGEKITIRKATPNKSMRILWSDGATILDVRFTSKGEEKSQVSLGHLKLKDAKEAEEKKAYWKEKLGKLKEMLEG